MASQTEKVSCFYCKESILLKNLKTHNQRFHHSLKVKYKSISSKNVIDLFKNASTSDLNVQQIQVCDSNKPKPEEKVCDEQKTAEEQLINYDCTKILDENDETTQKISSKRDTVQTDEENPRKKAKVIETSDVINNELLEQIVKTMTSKYCSFIFLVVLLKKKKSS